MATKNFNKMASGKVLGMHYDAGKTVGCGCYCNNQPQSCSHRIESFKI